MREVLATPIQQRVYFAGEASHFDGHHATVHGAMEIAEWSVETLLSENKDIKKENA